MDKKTAHYPITNEMLAEMEHSLSLERLTRYLVETQGNRKEALRLYAWNTSVSAAFYGPLQALEIALRNAMHNRLSEKYSTDWYDKVPLIRKNSIQLATVKSNLENRPDVITPPDIISELSFGFWVLLLSHPYEMTLWRPTLRKAFPHAKAIKRKQAYDPLRDLKDLRNRIAHHRPIFFHPLDRYYCNILEVIGWISPHKRNWVAAHSRVEEILDMPQDSPAVRF